MVNTTEKYIPLKSLRFEYLRSMAKVFISENVHISEVLLVSHCKKYTYNWEIVFAIGGVHMKRSYRTF